MRPPEVKALEEDLSATTHDLNAVLERAEATFTAMNLGVTASVALFVDDESDFCQILTFGKFNHRWCLMLESGPDGDPDLWRTAPIGNASREVRAEAIDRLEPLYRELLKTAAAETAALRTKVTKASSFLDKLTGGGAS
ncbi:MAG: hypothetical protein Q8P41_06850 [Pseudomonadota bacterium]|nr:hypothetical protein [Pseudomonadota bacterium]